MQSQNKSQLAEDCTTIIHQLLYYGYDHHHTIKQTQRWRYEQEVAKPIMHYVTQMKTTINQLQQQLLTHNATTSPTYLQDQLTSKDYLYHETAPNQLQKQLHQTKQLLHQYKYKAQIYHSHWIGQLAQITDKNLQIATLKAQKQKISKQLTATLQIYKKQVELNSELSKQCSLNYAAYLKQAETAKQLTLNQTNKQNEIQEIEQLKVQIEELKGVVGRFAQQSAVIELAYNQLYLQNKALQEEIIVLKQHGLQKGLMMNNTPRSRHNNNEVLQQTHQSIRTRKKKNTSLTNHSASNIRQQLLLFFNQEDAINEQSDA